MNQSERVATAPLPAWALDHDPQADFVLLTALEEEREALLSQLGRPARVPPSHADVRVYYAGNFPVTFSDGRAGAYRTVVLSVGGMGRVKAADATADAIRRWRPRYVVLVGIAGGIAAQDVAVGDIVVAEQ